MPVIPSIATNRISQNEFQGLAYEVMRQVFGIHNDFGRLFDKKVYKKKIVEEALAHCLGGEEALSSLVPVFGSCGQLSEQRMLLVSPNVTFRLTAFPDRQDVFELHARRLIEHTSIEAILWANIRHRQVTFKTIQ